MRPLVVVRRATAFDPRFVERDPLLSPLGPAYGRIGPRWHDLMNALVWATFPAAKAALHSRQHRAIVGGLAPGACTLPRRTPELDALALVDEGGVVVGGGGGPVVVFGHAIYESVALGVRPAVVAGIVGNLDPRADPVREADRLLARALEDRSRFLTPRELARVDLGAP